MKADGTGLTGGRIALWDTGLSVLEKIMEEKIKEEKKINMPETILELPNVRVYDDCMDGISRNATVGFHQGGQLSIKFEYEEAITTVRYWSVHGVAECFIEFMLGKYCYHFAVSTTIIRALMRLDSGFECKPNMLEGFRQLLCPPTLPITPGGMMGGIWKERDCSCG